MVEKTAIINLNPHRIMAISTVRPGGWPQNTPVGYANEGFDVLFLIFRSSQKFANIQHDRRVSIALGEEPADLAELQAVYAGVQVGEVTDPKQRDYAWRLLAQRHSNLADFEDPDPKETALMRAACKHVSVLDFTQGFGHKEGLTLGDGGAEIELGGAKDEWGRSPAGKKGNHRPSQ